ncbi:MAG: hypothetical protein ACI9R3_002907 [Verrucomicrobiales bacterium]|jgi:hypothetical protein
MNEIKEIERAYPYGEIDDSNAPLQKIEAFIYTIPRVFAQLISEQALCATIPSLRFHPDYDGGHQIQDFRV